MNSRGFLASGLSTYDLSTLYTTLPHNLIKEKLTELIEQTFNREGSLYLVCNDKNAWVKLALWDTSYFLNDRVRMCRVCSGALWILQYNAILYEPAHEIMILVRLSCNESSDEPAKMRILARVPPKNQGEVRLTLEKEYRIATETHILHATETLNSNPCWCSSRSCCQDLGFLSR